MRLFALVLLLSVVVRVQAQPADEYNTEWLKDPYQLLLVVQAEPHPLLTNVFVETFTRELGDSLQRDLGRTGKVNTLIYRETGGNRDLPRQMMESVIQRGWAELDNLPKQVNPIKIQLVRLFYVDGEYEVQTRQVDGDTSIVSVLRKARTTDRQWITRLAALQIAQDFGQVGEIVEVHNQTLRIKMRAGGLGIPETIRMVQGEAMAIAQIRRTSESYTAIRLPETIAYVTNVDAGKGLVTARLYSGRLENPLSRDKQTIAFRTIKLGTRVTPLQLKVLDQDNNPIGGYSVSHFPSGYENGGAETLGTTDVQGRITSKEPINHVAFVRVQIAGVGKLDTPIALLDEQPVIVKINNNQEAVIIDETKFEYDRWMRKYKEIKDNFEVDYKTLYLDVMKKGDTKKSLENLNMIVTKLKESVEELRTEFGRVQKAAQTSKRAMEYVDSAQAALKAMDQSTKDMQETINLELNPTEDRKFLKVAKQADADYDFDEAILNYKKSYNLNKNQPKVLERVKTLERIWNQQYRDKDHKDARNFALQVWANKMKPLNWEEIGKEITNAERFLDDLEKRGDYLTVLIMIKADLKHIGTLNAARDGFGTSEENQEKQVIIEKTRQALIDFDKKSRDFVAKAINEENKSE